MLGKKQMAVEFFKNLAAVCSSDKIRIREVDIYPISLILLHFIFGGRNFVSGPDGSGILPRISSWNSAHKNKPSTPIVM